MEAIARRNRIREEARKRKVGCPNGHSLFLVGLECLLAPADVGLPHPVDKPSNSCP